MNKYYGDCPTCRYDYHQFPYRPGVSLCRHPAGEQYSKEGLVSKCDGWIKIEKEKNRGES